MMSGSRSSNQMWRIRKTNRARAPANQHSDEGFSSVQFSGTLNPMREFDDNSILLTDFRIVSASVIIVRHNL